LLLLCGLIAPAHADLSAMEAAFSTGAFKEAALMGEEDGGSQALAFAARALLAEAGLTHDIACRDRSVEQAMKNAETALAGDPNNVEAHLQLAIALGLKARRVGTLRAHLMGLALEAKRHVERALTLSPDSPWAYAVNGAWNLEIVGRGGNLAGRAFYGASREAGIAAYDRAIALAPGNIVLHYERALALIWLDPERLKGEALKSLAAVRSASPANFMERAVAERAKELEAALKDGDTVKLAALLVHLRGDYEKA
jgi:tetratricopeptide (TPR) repeat protein